MEWGATKPRDGEVNTYSQELMTEIVKCAVEAERHICIAMAKLVRDEEKDPGQNICPPCQFHTADRIIGLIENGVERDGSSYHL